MAAPGLDLGTWDSDIIEHVPWSTGMIQPVDILAIAAHRDDVEQTCGGTLLQSSSIGLRTAILDLTQGEAGTRGTSAERAAEAEEAAKILGASWRHALDLPDGRLENTWENRLKIATVLRQAQPRVVILPYWQARHPDHAIVATLGYEACFVAGLAKVETGRAAASSLQNSLRKPVCGCATDLRRRHHTLHRAALSILDGLPLAIRKSSLWRQDFCSAGRNSRAHLRPGTLLRNARRRALCRALRPKRNWPGRGPDTHSRAVDLAGALLNPKRSLMSGLLRAYPPELTGERSGFIFNRLVLQNVLTFPKLASLLSLRYARVNLSPFRKDCAPCLRIRKIKLYLKPA